MASSASRSTPAIRAVFFDIGNVLLHFSAREIARKMAWAVRRHPINLVRFFWDSRIGAAIEKGELSPRALYRHFQEELGYEGSFEQFRLLWCDHFTLDRGAAALLKAVRKSRPVYLLSNTNVLHFEFIQERYAFACEVDGAILSYKLGVRKPEAAIYHAALKRARVAPEESVFIDDLKPNVAAAAKLGIKAIRYSGAEALRRELEGLGVLSR